jgi:branched-chain amino acid transport system ATP-binding protein
VTALLETKGIEVRYGGVPAVRGLDLVVNEGEIVALLGANGAGKTSTLRMLSGLVPAARGRVTFDGKRIEKLLPYQIVGLGLGHVPEGRRIFATMSVLENLEMGAFRRRGSLAADFERVFTLFPILGDRKKQFGGTLSGGEQQMLAIGRALMSEPKMLMFDEPSLGLAPMLVDQIFSIISEIRTQGTTVLLVEQNANQALHLADRGYVLETGQVTFQDSAEALLGDTRIREAYLGETKAE